MSLCTVCPFARSTRLRSAPLHRALARSTERRSAAHPQPREAGERPPAELLVQKPPSRARSRFSQQSNQLPRPFPAGSRGATRPLPPAPGFVNTDLFRHAPLWLKPLLLPLVWLFFRDAAEGAGTSLHCAAQPGLERFSGRYFADCRPREPWPPARDDRLARALWEASERLVGLGADGGSPSAAPRGLGQ